MFILPFVLNKHLYNKSYFLPLLRESQVNCKVTKLKPISRIILAIIEQRRRKNIRNRRIMPFWKQIGMISDDVHNLHSCVSLLQEWRHINGEQQRLLVFFQVFCLHQITLVNLLNKNLRKYRNLHTQNLRKYRNLSNRHLQKGCVVFKRLPQH